MGIWNSWVLSRDPQGQNYFHNNSNLLFAYFIVLDIATDCAKATVGKSDAILAETKTVEIIYF